MFSGYCKKRFTAEAVEVVAPSGKVTLTPNLDPVECRADKDYVNRILGTYSLLLLTFFSSSKKRACIHGPFCFYAVNDIGYWRTNFSSIGLKLDTKEMVHLLQRMCLQCKADGNQLIVAAPPTRSDILHACDVVEDVGIAYGFNKLPVDPPPTISLGKQNELMRMTEKMRLELAFAGYTEALTLSLCARAENFEMLNQPDDNSAVVIGNPKTIEFQVGRTNLLVGLLKTLAHNQFLPLPIRVSRVYDCLCE